MVFWAVKLNAFARGSGISVLIANAIAGPPPVHCAFRHRRLDMLAAAILN
jgi:hypothetical protein